MTDAGRERDERERDERDATRPRGVRPLLPKSHGC
jgi:hypothetical protein